jgi:hypothetical protein
MTVSNTTPLVENKTGNGSWTTIAVTPGQILQNSDGTHAIKVIRTTIATGVSTTLAETTDYTVVLDGTSPSTGTITLVGGAPSSAYRYTVLSDLAPKQEVNLQNGTIVDMEDIESALDRLTLYAQKQDEKLERAIVLPEDTLVRNLAIDSLDAQAGKVLKVNSTEDGFDYVDVAEGITQATFDINALSEIDSVVTSTDKLPIYDVSTGLTKYVTPDDLGIGGAASGLKGNVQQIQYVTKTDTFSQAVTAGTWYDITGLSVNITPSSSDSQLFIGGFVSLGQTTGEPVIRVMQDNTMVAPLPVLTGASNRCHATTQTPGALVAPLVPFNFLIPCKTTNTQTIKVQLSSTNTSTCNINSTITDTDTNVFPRCVSHLYVMEILNPSNPTGTVAQYIETVEDSCFASSNTLATSVLSRNPGKSTILSLTPISSSSYNILLCHLRAYGTGGAGALKGNIFKNESEMFSATSPGSRLSITSQAVSPANNGISFALTETLASDDAAEYVIRSGASAVTYTMNGTATTGTALSTNKWISNFIAINFITSGGSAYKQLVSSTLSSAETATSQIVGTFYTPTLSATIIPNSSSNYLFITCNLTIGVDDSGTGRNAFFKFTRDGSDILVGDTAGSRTRCTAHAFVGDDATTHTFSLSCILPATSTSSTTIGVKVGTDDTVSTTAYVNRSHTDTDSTSFMRGVSQISVIEIDPIA